MGAQNPPAKPTSVIYPAAGVGNAAANTALIQAALNKGGLVTIGSPTLSTFYTNGRVVIDSNTELRINSGTTWKQAPGVGDNMIVSKAYTTSWTALYDNSGSITTGPLSIIFSGTPTVWAQSTAYTKGSYVYANNNVYWCATAGTSSNSGTGPATTGTNITDGTAAWNYVTPNSYGINTAPTGLTAIVHWPAHGLSAGAAVWLTPQADTGGGTVWTGTQAAGTLGGPCDTAYFGVFYVPYINDADHFTVILRRLPAAAFTGIPMNAKVASQNIKIASSGILDYDQANQSGPSYIGSYGVIMAGVQNLIIDGLTCQNTAKWIFYGIGLSNADLGRIQGSQQWTTGVTNGDQVDIYGPAFDVHVHDMNGTGYDDILAIATQYHGANSSAYTLAAGDVINVTASRIRSFGGYAVSVYPIDANCILDAITLDDISVHALGQTSLQNFPAIRISPISNPGTGTIGVMTVKNCEMRDNNVGLISTGYTGNFTIERLLIENTRSSRNTARAALLTLQPQNGNTQTITDLIVRNNRIQLSATNTADALVLLQPVSGGTCVVTHALIHGNTITSNAAAHGTVFEIPNAGIGTVTLGHVTVADNYISGLNNVVLAGQAGDFTIRNNRVLATSAIFVTYGVSVVRFGDNYFSGASNGVVRYGAAVNNTVFSSGGNTMVSGSIWFAYPSAGTATVSGWDIQGDITKMTRTSGSFFYNTNTAPGSGTLNTAGLVACTGTASNSWALLTNPSGQQY